MGFLNDLSSSVTGGLAGSSNPYIAAAGGLLGGGGGSGNPIVAAPPPPLPGPPVQSGAPIVGSVASNLGWWVGGIMLVVLLALVFGVKSK